MPIVTRSMRPFEHDVKLMNRCLRKMHSGFVLKKGVVTELRINRPNTFETECHIRMPLYGEMLERQRLCRGLVQGAVLRVTAFHAKMQTSYDRGLFRVAKSSPKFVHLEKAWEEAVQLPAKKQRVVKLTTMTTTPRQHAPDELCFFPPSNLGSSPVAAPANALPLTTPPPSQATGDKEELYFFKPEDVSPARASSVNKMPPHVTTFQPFVSRTYARPPRRADEDETASTTSTMSSDSGKRRSIPCAVRTTVDGVEYRSRLEANFARLLTALNVRFVYEPIKYNQQHGPRSSTYTIDFFLPAQQLYVELKPKRPHVEEERKCEEMSKSGFRVVLMYGSSVFKLPFRSEYFRGKSHRDYVHHDALRGMAWIDGVKLAGETVFVFGNHGSGRTSPFDVPGAPCVHLDQVVSTDDVRWSHAAIADPIKALQQQSRVVP